MAQEKRVEDLEKVLSDIRTALRGNFEEALIKLEHQGFRSGQAFAQGKLPYVAPDLHPLKDMLEEALKLSSRGMS